jgi:formate dehydrogenase
MSDNAQTAAPEGGKRRGRFGPRGRQVTAQARHDIRLLLGDASRSRDLLIEHLHLVQDKFGAISAAHLAALAEEMHLPMAEVYEVATFYAHFDVLREAEAPPPPVTVRVCESLSCCLAGADALHDRLAEEAWPDVRVLRAPCMGHCNFAPAVKVGQRFVDHADFEQIQELVAKKRTHPVLPRFQTFEAYEAEGGYHMLRECRAGEVSAAQLIADLHASGLRGLGGAGFPTARKWEFVRAEPGPRYVVMNADEGEPGTFKDRLFLETTPHRVLEGLLLAAWAVEAAAAYIYLRDEYPAARNILMREIAWLEHEGLVPAGYIHLRRGAGAYICGEESAMLESIEGKRGLPRHRPPFAAQVGLFGRPTLIQNVETLYWLPEIFAQEPGVFAQKGVNGYQGLRAFSVSGRVAEPGVKIAPNGITLNELIAQYCGGMAAGHRLKAFLPGGPSGGILPAAKADTPLGFGAFDAEGCFIGSGAIIVLSDRDDLRIVARNLLHFFAEESCGQCTPCRVGTEKLLALTAAPEWDAGLMREIATAMADASICGLGQAAANPLSCLMRFFPEAAPTGEGA